MKKSFNVAVCDIPPFQNIFYKTGVEYVFDGDAVIFMTKTERNEYISLTSICYFETSLKTLKNKYLIYKTKDSFDFSHYIASFTKNLDKILSGIVNNSSYSLTIKTELNDDQPPKDLEERIFSDKKFKVYGFGNSEEARKITDELENNNFVLIARLGYMFSSIYNNLPAYVLVYTGSFINNKPTEVILNKSLEPIGDKELYEMNKKYHKIKTSPPCVFLFLDI